MKRKMLSVILATAMVASVVSGCGSTASTSDTAAPAATEEATGTTEAAATPVAAGKEDNIIKIGAVCAMTGGSAIYGEGAQNAVDMAVEEINAAGGDYTVEIVNGGKVVDDAKDSKQAVNAYNSLIPDGPEAVIGSFFSSVTLPMAELANDQGMLLLACGATNTNVTLTGPTIFRDCFIDPYQGKMAAKFASEKGAAKAAVIYAKDDDYSNGLMEAFVENAEAGGIEVVYTGECTTTDTDFTAQASQAVASGADFVFYPCFLDTVPLFVQQVRDAGFEGMIMGGDGWDGSDTTGLETYFDNCYFTNHYSSEDTSEAVQSFVSKYTEKYGTESLTACAALYYDAIYMLVEAAKNGGGTDTASLVSGMTGMTFTGVGGTFTMDENGDPEKAIVVNTYDNGQIKWLETLQP
ncbi:MAG: ABC transporter substrate-binding protein [Lachnospiraceae bacterium]|nr:ABC transporter substrate-binding protein [Lachnospiraceae bacterium]